MKKEDFEAILRLITYPSYTFIIGEKSQGLFLQGSYLDEDTYNGLIEKQHTRKWMLSEHMTRSEFVQTVFKCVMTSHEHRVREAFKYKGERVYGPHFNVERLYELAKNQSEDRRK